MKNNKMELTAVLLSLANLIVAVVFILRLPETVPTHYNVDWVCDGVGSRWTGMILPVLAVIMPLIAPLINNKSQKTENGRHVAQIVILMIDIFFIVYGWFIMISMDTGVQIGEQAGIPDMGWLMSVLLAFMFIGMGNYMPIMPQSKTLGIKIKYTLENEACWKLTHRMAGKLWVATGIVHLLLSLLALLLHAEQFWMFILLFVMMTVNMVVPCIYAYQHKDA